MASKRTPALGFIFITILVDVIGFGIIIPVMPELISNLAHVPISKAASYGGWLLFAYAIMQFLFSPILGNLSDRYGRRPVLLFSLFGFGIDYLFLAFAPSFTWLFIGRIIAGITGASFTTASAYIADISTPQNRAKNFGVIGAAFGMGFVLGPGIGGLIGEVWGTRAPFVAAAILTLINWLYGYFILPESHKIENRRKFEWKRANPLGSLKQLKKYPAIGGLVFSLVLIYIAAHAVQSTWSYYTYEKFKWSKAMVGYSLTFVGVMIAIVQGGLIRIILPRWGNEKSIYIGLVFYTVGSAFMGFAPTGWMLYVFTAIYCLGAIVGPALQAVISTHVPPTEQGELQGGLNSMISLTTIAGPLIMTNLFSWFTRPSAPFYFPGMPFLAASFFLLISAIFAYRELRAEKKLAE